MVAGTSETPETVLTGADGPYIGAAPLKSLVVSFRTRNEHSLQSSNFPFALPTLEKHLRAQRIIAAAFEVAEP